ncbi:MAG: glycosyltransferase [Burkholderiaceae bacterium]|nr:glycosyltransferase [Burkholderiaceae bacterium]
MNAAPSPRPDDPLDTTPVALDDLPEADAGAATRSDAHRRPMPMSGSPGRVLHCVGRLDSDEAHSLLWPTVLALADAGVRQCVVVLHPADAEHARLLLPREVPLVVAPRTHAWLHRHRELQRLLQAQLRSEPLLALHLHGRAAALPGLRAMQACGVHAPVFFHSPEQPARRPHWRLSARWLTRLAGLRDADAEPTAYVVVPGRVDPLSAAAVLHDEALERPVPEHFFHLGHAESAHPLVVTAGRAQDLDFAAAYAQLAVLLAGSHPQLQFAWLGDADEAVQAVLKAAQVQLLPCRDDHERARHLSGAWLYLAPEGDRGDARGVIEAMAAGLPCVARPGSACGELVIDQLSGFLCPRAEDLLQGIARLIDAPELRRAMGQAARERSLQRYSRHRFHASMLLAHGLPARLESRTIGFAPQAAFA